jgi:hypothetical protein
MGVKVPHQQRRRRRRRGAGERRNKPTTERFFKGLLSFLSSKLDLLLLN